jgi:hypothetical protein
VVVIGVSISIAPSEGPKPAAQSGRGKFARHARE